MSQYLLKSEAPLDTKFNLYALLVLLPAVLVTTITFLYDLTI